MNQPDADDSVELFDRSEEYDAMLDEGLRLTGEGKMYYVHGRLELLREVLPPQFDPARVLDFGCGTGDTAATLADMYPRACILGVDTASNALLHARRRFGSDRIRFESVEVLEHERDFDLCHVNGVFHHIPIDFRDDAVARIRTSLADGGYLALFENNPWNPGTRMVMRRIPFDRDAHLLSPVQTRALLLRHRFELSGAVRYTFFFPAALRALRPLEFRLRGCPLGGQYLVLATRPHTRVVSVSTRGQ